MKCSNCGGVLSLKATHCLTCRRPVSPVPYTPSQQNMVFPVPTVNQPARPFYGASTPVQQPSLSYTQSWQQPSQMVSPAVAPNRPVQAVPEQKRRRGILIIGILAGLLLIAGISIFFVQGTDAGNANVPSSGGIDANASTILVHPQLSSSIDSQLAPMQPTTTFTANRKIYLTFAIASGNQDGYIKAKWYADGQSVSSTSFQHLHANTSGVFSATYITPTTNGLIELYWCTQANCSDAQLAQVVHFTVKPVDITTTGRVEGARVGDNIPQTAHHA